MAVKDWHPGKVVLMWAVYVAVLLYLASYPGSDEAALWMLLVIIPFAITWRWFSGREKKD